MRAAVHVEEQGIAGAAASQPKGFMIQASTVMPARSKRKCSGRLSVTSPFQSRLRSVSRRSPPPSAPQTKTSAGESGSLAAKAMVPPVAGHGEAADDPLARDDPA